MYEPRVCIPMGSPASFLDLTSDEEHNSMVKLSGGFSGAFDGRSEAAGAKHLPPLVEQKKAGEYLGVENCGGNDDSDDDCQILDSDPDKPVLVAPGKGSGEDGSDELVIVGEKGELACRDFPHPRHLCANFPFSSSPHVKHCSLCHCYVCDQPAPCKFWGNGMLVFDHCHSTDKDIMWKSRRQSFKQNMELSQPQNAGTASSGHPVQVPAPSLRLNTLQPCSASFSNSFQPCSATGLGNSFQPFSVASLANALQPCSGTSLANAIRPCWGTSLYNTLKPALCSSFPSTVQPCLSTSFTNTLQPCLSTSFTNTLQPCLSTSFTNTFQPCSGIANTYLMINRRHHRQPPVHSFHSQRPGPYSATTCQINSRTGSVQRHSSLTDAQASEISSSRLCCETQSADDLSIFNQTACANSLSTNHPPSGILNNNWRPNHVLQESNSANVTSQSYQYPGVQPQISQNSRLTSATVGIDEIESAPLRSYNAPTIMQAIDSSRSWQDILAFADSNIEVPSGNMQNFTVLQQPNAVISQPMQYVPEVSHRVANQSIVSGQSTPDVGQKNSPNYFHSWLNSSAIPDLQQVPGSIVVDDYKDIIQNGFNLLPAANCESVEPTKELKFQDD